MPKFFILSIMEDMKKKLSTLLVILLVVPAMLSAVVPVSRHVGKVDTFPESGSITARAIEAFRAEFTDTWLETYTTADKAIIDFWSDTLLDILPLGNLIAGEEKDGAVSLYDLDEKIYISLVFNEDKLISALEIER